MATDSSSHSQREPVGVAGVFLIELIALADQAQPWTIDGRPVRACAPHPERPDLIYVTIEHPDLLSFLPDECFELEG